MASAKEERHVKQRSLDRRTHTAILKELRAKSPRATIPEDHDLPAFVVGKIAAAAGLGKVRAEVRRADKAIVEKWLAAGKPARRRSRKPAA